MSASVSRDRKNGVKDAPADGGGTRGSSTTATERICQSLREFCSYTTAHGLGRFSSQSVAFGRVIWLAFLVGTYSGFAYHLYTLFDRFFSLPLLTSLTTSLAYQFPDVYFCPTDALSLSKWTDASEAKTLDMVINCDARCKQGFLAFNIMNGSADPTQMLLKPVQLSESALALSDVMASVETALTHEFRFIMQANTSNCRFTGSGEEYSGPAAQADSAPIYSDSAVTQFLDNEEAMKSALPAIKPYQIEKPCISWNLAARRLRDYAPTWPAAAPLAARILALKLDEADSRCRHPVGLPLKEFADVAMKPVLQYAGCYADNVTRSMFQFKCFAGIPFRSLTPEVCQECCYNANFTHLSLQGGYCSCATDFDAKPRGIHMDSCTQPCSGNAWQMCGGQGVQAYSSVYRVRDKGWKPLYIPFKRQSLSFHAGPYCFYDTGNSDGQLGATYCNVPYCSISPKYDCIISDHGGAVAANRHFSHYTGRVNQSAAAKRCLPWSQVKRNIETKEWRISATTTTRSSSPWFLYNLPFDARMDSHRVLGVHIETPDYSITMNDNYCRAVSVTIESMYTLENNSYVFSRESYINSVVPGCFTKKRRQYLEFEACKIDSCYDTMQSVTSVIRDSIGAALLGIHYSSDLRATLSKCSFGEQPCGKTDFVSMVHPELGVCHKFNKKAFITTDISALSKLSIKYFSDKLDPFGHEVPNAGKIENAIRDPNYRSESQSSLKVGWEERGRE